MIVLKVMMILIDVDSDDAVDDDDDGYDGESIDGDGIS